MALSKYDKQRILTARASSTTTASDAIPEWLLEAEKARTNDAEIKRQTASITSQADAHNKALLAKDPLSRLYTDKTDKDGYLVPEPETAWLGRLERTRAGYLKELDAPSSGFIPTSADINKKADLQDKLAKLESILTASYTKSGKKVGRSTPTAIADAIRNIQAGSVSIAGMGADLLDPDATGREKSVKDPNKSGVENNIDLFRERVFNRVEDLTLQGMSRGTAILADATEKGLSFVYGKSKVGDTLAAKQGDVISSLGDAAKKEIGINDKERINADTLRSSKGLKTVDEENKERLSSKINVGAHELSDWMKTRNSLSQKVGSKKVADAAETGFIPAVKSAVLDNPGTTVTGLLAESAPFLLLGSMAGRGLKSLGASDGVATAGAVGVGSGSDVMSGAGDAERVVAAMSPIELAKSQAYQELKAANPQATPKQLRDVLTTAAGNSAAGVGLPMAALLATVGSKLGLNPVEAALSGAGPKGSSLLSRVVGSGMSGKEILSATARAGAGNAFAASREAVGEVFEEGSNKLSQNEGEIAGGARSEAERFKGVAGAGALGGVMGGVMSAGTTTGGAAADAIGAYNQVRNIRAAEEQAPTSTTAPTVEENVSSTTDTTTPITKVKGVGPTGAALDSTESEQEFPADEAANTPEAISARVDAVYAPAIEAAKNAGLAPKELIAQARDIKAQLEAGESTPLTEQFLEEERKQGAKNRAFNNSENTSARKAANSIRLGTKDAKADHKTILSRIKESTHLAGLELFYEEQRKRADNAEYEVVAERMEIEADAAYRRIQELKGKGTKTFNSDTSSLTQTPKPATIEEAQSSYEAKTKELQQHETKRKGLERKLEDIKKEVKAQIKSFKKGRKAPHLLQMLGKRRLFTDEYSSQMGNKDNFRIGGTWAHTKSTYTGMTLHQLREWMEENEYLPEFSYDTDALELYNRAIRGEEIHNFATMSDKADQMSDDRYAQEADDEIRRLQDELDELSEIEKELKLAREESWKSVKEFQKKPESDKAEPKVAEAAPTPTEAPAEVATTEEVSLKDAKKAKWMEMRRELKERQDALNAQKALEEEQAAASIASGKDGRSITSTKKFKDMSFFEQMAIAYQLSAATDAKEISQLLKAIASGKMSFVYNTNETSEGAITPASGEVVINLAEFTGARLKQRRQAADELKKTANRISKLNDKTRRKAIVDFYFNNMPTLLQSSTSVVDSIRHELRHDKDFAENTDWNAVDTALARDPLWAAMDFIGQASRPNSQRHEQKAEQMGYYITALSALQNNPSLMPLLLLTKTGMKTYEESREYIRNFNPVKEALSVPGVYNSHVSNLFKDYTKDKGAYGTSAITRLDDIGSASELAAERDVMAMAGVGYLNPDSPLVPFFTKAANNTVRIAGNMVTNLPMFRADTAEGKLAKPGIGLYGSANKLAAQEKGGVASQAGAAGAIESKESGYSIAESSAPSIGTGFVSLASLGVTEADFTPEVREALLERIDSVLYGAIANKLAAYSIQRVDKATSMDRASLEEIRNDSNPNRRNKQRRAAKTLDAIDKLIELHKQAALNGQLELGTPEFVAFVKKAHSGAKSRVDALAYEQALNLREAVMSKTSSELLERLYVATIETSKEAADIEATLDSINVNSAVVEDTVKLVKRLFGYQGSLVELATEYMNEITAYYESKGAEPPTFVDVNTGLYNYSLFPFNIRPAVFPGKSKGESHRALENAIEDMFGAGIFTGKESSTLRNGYKFSMPKIDAEYLADNIGLTMALNVYARGLLVAMKAPHSVVYEADDTSYNPLDEHTEANSTLSDYYQEEQRLIDQAALDEYDPYVAFGDLNEYESFRPTDSIYRQLDPTWAPESGQNEMTAVEHMKAMESDKIRTLLSGAVYIPNPLAKHEFNEIYKAAVKAGDFKKSLIPNYSLPFLNRPTMEDGVTPIYNVAIPGSTVKPQLEGKVRQMRGRNIGSIDSTVIHGIQNWGTLDSSAKGNIKKQLYNLVRAYENDFSAIEERANPTLRDINRRKEAALNAALRQVNNALGLAEDVLAAKSARAGTTKAEDSSLTKALRQADAVAGHVWGGSILTKPSANYSASYYAANKKRLSIQVSWDGSRFSFAPSESTAHVVPTRNLRSPAATVLYIPEFQFRFRNTKEDFEGLPEGSFEKHAYGPQSPNYGKELRAPAREQDAFKAAQVADMLVEYLIGTSPFMAYTDTAFKAFKKHYGEFLDAAGLTVSRAVLGGIDSDTNASTTNRATVDFMLVHPKNVDLDDAVARFAANRNTTLEDYANYRQPAANPIVPSVTPIYEDVYADASIVGYDVTTIRDVVKGILDVKLEVKTSILNGVSEARKPVEDKESSYYESLRTTTKKTFTELSEEGERLRREKRLVTLSLDEVYSKLKAIKDSKASSVAKARADLKVAKNYTPRKDSFSTYSGRRTSSGYPKKDAYKSYLVEANNKLKIALKDAKTSSKQEKDLLKSIKENEALLKSLNTQLQSPDVYNSSTYSLGESFSRLVTRRDINSIVDFTNSGLAISGARSAILSWANFNPSTRFVIERDKHVSTQEAKARLEAWSASKMTQVNGVAERFERALKDLNLNEADSNLLSSSLGAMDEVGGGGAIQNSLRAAFVSQWSSRVDPTALNNVLLVATELRQSIDDLVTEVATRSLGPYSYNTAPAEVQAGYDAIMASKGQYLNRTYHRFSIHSSTTWNRAMLRAFASATSSASNIATARVTGWGTAVWGNSTAKAASLVNAAVEAVLLDWNGGTASALTMAKPDNFSTLNSEQKRKAALDTLHGWFKDSTNIEQGLTVTVGTTNQGAGALKARKLEGPQNAAYRALLGEMQSYSKRAVASIEQQIGIIGGLDTLNQLHSMGILVPPGTGNSDFISIPTSTVYSGFNGFSVRKDFQYVIRNVEKAAGTVRILEGLASKNVAGASMAALAAADLVASRTFGYIKMATVFTNPKLWLALGMSVISYSLKATRSASTLKTAERIGSLWYHNQAGAPILRTDPLYDLYQFVLAAGVIDSAVFAEMIKAASTGDLEQATNFLESVGNEAADPILARTLQAADNVKDVAIAKWTYFEAIAKIAAAIEFKERVDAYNAAQGLAPATAAEIGIMVRREFPSAANVPMWTKVPERWGITMFLGFLYQVLHTATIGLGQNIATSASMIKNARTPEAKRAGISLLAGIIGGTVAQYGVIIGLMLLVQTLGPDDDELDKEKLSRKRMAEAAFTTTEDPRFMLYIGESKSKTPLYINFQMQINPLDVFHATVRRSIDALGPDSRETLVQIVKDTIPTGFVADYFISNKTNEEVLNRASGVGILKMLKAIDAHGLNPTEDVLLSTAGLLNGIVEVDPYKRIGNAQVGAMAALDDKTPGKPSLKKTIKELLAADESYNSKEMAEILKPDLDRLHMKRADVYNMTVGMYEASGLSEKQFIEELEERTMGPTADDAKEVLKTRKGSPKEILDKKKSYIEDAAGEFYNTSLKKGALDVTTVSAMYKTGASNRNSVHQAAITTRNKTSIESVLFGEPKAKGKISGKVVNVVDADTIDIKTASGSIERIRVQNVDAFELKQILSDGTPIGKEGQAYLNKLILGNDVSGIHYGRDDKHRYIARVTTSSGKDAGTVIAEAGYAIYTDIDDSDDYPTVTERKYKRETAPKQNRADKE